MESLFSSQDILLFEQLALAVFLGMVIGLERTLAGKSAGLRTFALVSLGACLFTIISRIAPDFLGRAGFDPSRIASQIVVGIGFLGAGLIIHTESKSKGLTTAAGLWVTAAIGMAVGYALYAIAIAATVLTLCIFLVLWVIEHRFVKEAQHLHPITREHHDDL